MTLCTSRMSTSTSTIPFRTAFRSLLQQLNHQRLCLRRLVITSHNLSCRRRKVTNTASAEGLDLRAFSTFLFHRASAEAAAAAAGDINDNAIISLCAQL